MTKKKAKQKKAGQHSKEFSSSPFRTLKGLSTFPEQIPAENTGQRKAGGSASAPPKTTDDYRAFTEEMAFLGVKPLAGRRAPGRTGGAKNDGQDTPLSSAAAGEKCDREEFLAAVGVMTKAFEDDWAEAEEPVEQAKPRRMKQLERGRLRLEAELDLHGLTQDEATEKTRFFLQNSVHQGLRTVLLITGKGLHSTDGPVLRLAMEKLLNELSGQVLEWGIAPRRFGGDGALVVFLRQPESG